MRKRPLAVTVIALLYLAVGIGAFVVNFRGVVAFESDALWAELVETVGMVCGVFLFLGQNWARWLAVAWIAGHVVLSAFHGFHGFVVHCLIAAGIAWLLFRPESAAYFRGRAADSSPSR